jgi:hypothetical protein
MVGDKDRPIEGTIAEIEGALPNGFHDAELASMDVDWQSAQAVLHGAVDFSNGAPPEIYRPFLIEVRGLRTLTLPMALASRVQATNFTLQFGDQGWCGGLEGWPPDRTPKSPPFPGAWVYSFFLHQLNDFITVQASAAQFTWAGKPESR